MWYLGVHHDIVFGSSWLNNQWFHWLGFVKISSDLQLLNNQPVIKIPIVNNYLLWFLLIIVSLCSQKKCELISSYYAILIPINFDSLLNHYYINLKEHQTIVSIEYEEIMLLFAESSCGLMKLSWLSSWIFGSLSMLQYIFWTSCWKNSVFKFNTFRFSWINNSIKSWVLILWVSIKFIFTYWNMS